MVVKDFGVWCPLRTYFHVDGHFAVAVEESQFLQLPVFGFEKARSVVVCPNVTGVGAALIDYGVSFEGDVVCVDFLVAGSQQDENCKDVKLFHERCGILIGSGREKYVGFVN